VLIPAWVGMWLVVGVLSAPWRHIVLYKTAWGWLPAAFSFAAGISLYRKSSANFSPKQLSGLAELRTAHPEQNLVTTGIRARVRHPVYLAHLCEMLAWSIGTGLAACYTLTLFTIVTGTLMIRMEDNELEQRFGDSYRAYKNSVPAFFPRLT
jgi:protein-S-isoprenylcysteine O-methyltransferase Ste14